MAAKKTKQSDLLKRVEAIDWDGLSRGQGKGFEKAFAKRSVDAMRKLFVRSDNLVYPIAGLALPFLIELLASEEKVDRPALLVLVTDIALWGHARWIEYGFDPKTTAEGFLSGRARARAHEAFLKGEPVFRALLAKPETRAAAALALAWIPGAKDALEDALRAETDPTTRASLWLALAQHRAPVSEALTSKAPIERLAGAIACTLSGATVPKLAGALAEDVKPDKALPWCGGDLRTLAKRRLVAITFGEEPDEVPASPPSLDAAQKEALRALVEGGMPPDVRTMLNARGFPQDDTALRRLAGVPRKIPEGKHARVFDRWMTWAETGVPSAAAIAKELAAEVPLEDAIEVIEQMYYAQQEAEEHIADWKFPVLPNDVAPPKDADDYNQPHAFYKYYAGSVDDCVRALNEAMHAAGYTTWSHGRDGENDLDAGNIVAWDDDGHEVHVGFDPAGDLVRVHYENGRTLVRAFTIALVERFGADKVLARLRKHEQRGMRQAIGLVRVTWAIADHTKTEVDPIGDELAFQSAVNRHYIYWTGRAHLERIPPARREKLVLRLLEENDDQLFGWVRFAPTPKTRAAASKMIAKTFGTSYYDLEGAEAAAERMLPYADDAIAKILEKAVKKDDNPVVQVILLGRMGRLDVVKKALDSEYPMARAAAKKVLAAAT